jgi:hypothetical protein
MLLFHNAIKKIMAVKEGFEPSIRDKPYTPLAGERLQPLGHLTVLRGLILLPAKNKSNTLLPKNSNHSTYAHLIANKATKPT